MNLKIAQLVITNEIETNFNKITHALESASEGDWVIFPEGMISGYYPEDIDFIKKIDFSIIRKKVELIQEIAKTKNIAILVGTVWAEGQNIFNSTLHISRSGIIRYDKVNLSTLDRNHFQPGGDIGTHTHDDIPFGIQMCRDFVFPEQSKLLKIGGAKIIFHINNAIKEIDSAREHLVWSRAFENQVYVCSVNNADYPQKQRSQLIDPNGQTLWESIPQTEVIHTVKINLDTVKNDYLTQSRTDLVQIVGK